MADLEKRATGGEKLKNTIKIPFQDLVKCVLFCLKCICVTPISIILFANVLS